MRGFISAILPGTRGGAKDMEESLAMLRAARDAGMTSITCTPRLVDPDADYLTMWRAFRALEREVRAVDPTFPLQMGFMVDCGTLDGLGTEWPDRLHFDGSNEFLVDLYTDVDKAVLAFVERKIGDLQDLGLQVIVSHPERSAALAEDPTLARGLVAMGCRLMVSASAADGGRNGDESRVAGWLLDEGLCSCFVVDGPGAEGFDGLARVVAAQGAAMADGGSPTEDLGRGADAIAGALVPYAGDADGRHDGRAVDRQRETASMGLSVRPLLSGDASGVRLKARPAARRRGRFAAIVAGIVVAVACVASLAFALTRPAPQKESAQGSAPAKAEVAQVAQATERVVALVRIDVVVPGLDEKGSRVPLHVSGTQSDGTKYEKDVFVGAGTLHLELPVGTYSVKAVGTPISADGTLYQVPKDALAVAVAKDGSATVTPDGARLEFSAADVSDVSDALIESARQLVLKDPERSERADELAAAARDALRDAEKGSAQESDETAQRRAEEDEEASPGAASTAEVWRPSQVQQQEEGWSSRWQQEPEEEQEETTQQEVEQSDQQQESELQQESGQQEPAQQEQQEPSQQEPGQQQQESQPQQRETPGDDSGSGGDVSANAS